MLVDFANTRPDTAAFERFKNRFESPHGLKWLGDEDDFRWSQGILRQVWEGKKKGIEALQVQLALGIKPDPHGESIGAPPIHVDWEGSCLFVAPRHLRDLIWLTLLQHSNQLAICENLGGGCQTPYFLRRKPADKYCSASCARPAQRAFKREWWRKHGKLWRDTQMKRK